MLSFLHKTVPTDWRSHQTPVVWFVQQAAGGATCQVSLVAATAAATKSARGFPAVEKHTFSWSTLNSETEVGLWMPWYFFNKASQKMVITLGYKIPSKYLESLFLKTKDQVWNLAMLIDSDLIFSSHIKSITKTAFYQLNNISSEGFYVSNRPGEADSCFHLK